METEIEVIDADLLLHYKDISMVVHMYSLTTEELIKIR